MTRTIPKQCIEFITAPSRDSFRAHAYYDSVGVLTIGYGHTGSDVYVGQTIALEQGKQLLAKDLQDAANAVGGVGLPFNDNQFSALVSFAFNVGVAGFLNSTLLSKIKASASEEDIRHEFDRWVHGNNREVLPGLVDRRKGEADLYYLAIVLPPPVSPVAKPTADGGSSSPISINDIITYYTGQPHQQDALRMALLSYLSNPVDRAKFLALWRNTRTATPESIPPKLGTIDWRNAAHKISAYFTVGEVTQGDPRRIPTDPQVITRILALAKKLDELRDAWGKLRIGTSGALGVTSWYRPELVNREVGGVANSAHILGYAADVYPLSSQPGDTELREFQDYCLKHWKGGVGRGAYKGFVHLDLGEDRQWDY